MNTIWYDCSVRYRKTTDLGSQKVVTESYLVDAISFTEAESRINEEMKAYISEEFRVTNIKLTNYSEVNPFNDSDRWFKSKVVLIAYDEESGKEQKVNTYLLVQANDAKQAYENTILLMKNTMGDYSIPSVSETKIIDIFPFISSVSE
jgi:hypothetical protein